MIDKEFLFRQQVTYLEKWINQLNRERLLEVKRLVDEGLGYAEFREKLKLEGIDL